MAGTVGSRRCRSNIGTLLCFVVLIIIFCLSATVFILMLLTNKSNRSRIDNNAFSNDSFYASSTPSSMITENLSPLDTNTTQSELKITTSQPSLFSIHCRSWSVFRNSHHVFQHSFSRYHCWKRNHNRNSYHYHRHNNNNNNINNDINNNCNDYIYYYIHNHNNHDYDYTQAVSPHFTRTITATNFCLP